MIMNEAEKEAARPQKAGKESRVALPGRLAHLLSQKDHSFPFDDLEKSGSFTIHPLRQSSSENFRYSQPQTLPCSVIISPAHHR